MYDSIITAAQSMTNVRGRYDFSVAVLDLELERLMSVRDFASNYGKSEWLAKSDSVKSVELCDEGYKKLIVCLSDGTEKDITEQVYIESTALSCSRGDDNDGFCVIINCGVIKIESSISIKAVRGLSKLPKSEIKKWFVREHPAVLTAFLRWQLLSDIDANSAGVAYNTYARLLLGLDKLKVV